MRAKCFHEESFLSWTDMVKSSIEKWGFLIGLKSLFVLWRFPAPCFPASHYLHCTLCIAISNWLTFERSIWDRSDTEYNMTNENEEYSWRIEHTIDNRRYHSCMYTCFTYFLSWKMTFFIFRSGARFLSKKIKNRDKKFKLLKDSFNPHSPGHTVVYRVSDI